MLRVPLFTDLPFLLPRIGIVFVRFWFEKLWVKTFLFQNVNLNDIDNDQLTDRRGSESQSVDGLIDNGISSENVLDEAENVEGVNEDPAEGEIENVEANQEDELASQTSDDQDESTVVNNENYDNNNDSAYETNEINSQNGSSSRLQSADTNDEDVDNETGENYLKISQEVDDEKFNDMENIEIEQFENDLENPPTPTPSADDDDNDESAENPKETGESTENDGGLDGNEAANDEVHDLHWFPFDHLPVL